MWFQLSIKWLIRPKTNKKNNKKKNSCYQQGISQIHRDSRCSITHMNNIPQTDNHEGKA